MKPNAHVTILEIAQNREYFTRHGLHLNSQGKENICEQLALSIEKLFQHSVLTPISLGWDNNQNIVETRATITHNDSNNDPNNMVLDDVVNATIKGEEPNVCRKS